MALRFSLTDVFIELVYDETWIPSLKSSVEYNNMKFLYNLVNGFINGPNLMGDLMFQFLFE